jgi:UDP-GlcNAc:undecaprenyl-phosphate GlcNAc-1-phosphate transferase
MPLIVLAVPLYDMTTVSLIRLRQGRSPMVGDMQHLSHRLVKRGLSKRAAVGVICGMTAATGIAGIALGSLEPWQAVLVGVQTALLLARPRRLRVRELARAHERVRSGRR